MGNREVNPWETNELQRSIMRFVDTWAREVKTPIPRKAIITHMVSVGVKDCTVINALNSLLRKGYIRRAVAISNKTSFVQLRRV
jgi:hypothetical protein